MATTGHRWAPVLGLAVAWAAAAEARPTRSGKVVRIERPRLVSSKRLQLCQVADPAAQTGYAGQNWCIGPKPDEAVEGAWFDFQTREVLGRVRILNPRPHPQDLCGLGQVHHIDAEVIESRGPPPTYMGIVVVNLEVGYQATMTNDLTTLPGGAVDEYVRFSLDRDGDGESDFAYTERDCTGTGAPPSSVAGRIMSSTCLSFWVLDGTQWRRIQEDVFHQCQ